MSQLLTPENIAIAGLVLAGLYLFDSMRSRKAAEPAPSTPIGPALYRAEVVEAKPLARSIRDIGDDTASRIMGEKFGEHTARQIALALLDTGSPGKTEGPAPKA